MTDRDRLIELKRKAINYAQEKADERGGLVCIDDEVDYLLANGVIVPPCKVGDDIWWIDTEANEINCAENDIKAICYYGEGNFKVIVCDDETPEDIGTEWCMLTKEEAERALKEREGK